MGVKYMENFKLGQLIKLGQFNELGQRGRSDWEPMMYGERNYRKRPRRPDPRSKERE